jgi:hypothetical protein
LEGYKLTKFPKMCKKNVFIVEQSGGFTNEMTQKIFTNDKMLEGIDKTWFSSSVECETDHQETSFVKVYSPFEEIFLKNFLEKREEIFRKLPIDGLIVVIKFNLEENCSDLFETTAKQFMNIFNMKSIFKHAKLIF